MAKKYWTLKEDTLIARAVREHPDRPHVEFKNIALLTGRTVGSVRGRYQRVYLNTGVMPKLRPGRMRKQSEIPVAKIVEKKEKKLNALQKFGKWLFNI